MKKLVILITALAVMSSVPLAVAKDVNWDSLRQQWNQQSGEQKKQDAKVKALEGGSKTQTANPTTGGTDKSGR